MWEDDIYKLEIDKSYKFESIFVRSFDSKKYLTVSKKCEIKPVADIGKVKEMDADDLRRSSQEWVSETLLKLSNGSLTRTPFCLRNDVLILPAETNRNIFARFFLVLQRTALLLVLYFLGHTVSDDGICPLSDKVQAISRPPPVNDNFVDS